LKNAVENYGGYERFMEMYELHYAPKQPTREVTKEDIKDEIASLRTLQKYASTAQEKQEIKARIESLNVLLKYQ
jgi:flagellum-specific peptidoglycan hydrolase FlgJ